MDRDNFILEVSSIVSECSFDGCNIDAAEGMAEKLYLKISETKMFTKEECWSFKNWYNVVDDDSPKMLSESDHKLVQKLMKECNN